MIYFPLALQGSVHEIICQARRRREIMCSMEPMSTIETHLYQNVALGSTTETIGESLNCTIETKFDNTEPAEEHAMCYIVTTSFIF